MVARGRGAGVAQEQSPHEAAATVRHIQREIVARTGVDLPLRLWDGTELGDAGAGFRVVLGHPWSLRALLRPPFDLSVGEAYVEGAIDLEGDPVTSMSIGRHLNFAHRDLVALTRLAHRLPRPPRHRHPRRAALHGRMHTPARDRAAIAFHYDLPQAFYEAFLDERLVYSCAYWLHDSESLESAQVRKLDVICRKLRLRPGQRLLDVGCGWGSLLMYAAREYGVHGVGVTLSRTQAEGGRELVRRAGLADRVEIRLTDYRDVDEHFDAVASVGMAEHVGPDHLGDYAAAVHRLLADGGLFLNHCIVSGDSHRVRTGRERTFANAYVFPDGGLVPAWRLVREIEQAGFRVLDLEQLRPHYARTLREWVRRIDAHHDAAVAAASEADYRIWRAYLSGCVVSFATGGMHVVQILGHKPGPASPADELPLGRAWMLPLT